MEVLSGKDDYDATTLTDFFESKKDTPKSLKIGVIKEAMDEGVYEEVRDIVTHYCENLRAAGHDVDQVSLPLAPISLAMYYVIVPAEISSNLARYDGVRYGVRATSESLEQLYGESRDKGFEAENKRRILIGSYVLSSGFYDAYFNQAAKARTLLIRQFDELFARYDVLISPVAPTTAFKLGENTDDPLKMYKADVMTVPASLAGLPAISVPAGKTQDGLPVGVQLIGQRKTDADILAVAKAMERDDE